MPHRAGYFVLAYHWDHHCNELTEALKARFAALRSDIEALPPPEKPAKALLEHALALQALRARLDDHLKEMERRCSVINELGFRGYGTNKDLLGSLESLRREHRETAEPALRTRFLALAPLLPEGTGLPAAAEGRILSPSRLPTRPRTPSRATSRRCPRPPGPSTPPSSRSCSSRPAPRP